MKKNIPPAKNNVHDYPGRCQKVVAVWPNGNVAGFFDSIKVRKMNLETSLHI